MSWKKCNGKLIIEFRGFSLEDICKYMCEKFCDIWANIVAQIASEALRIRVHRRSV